MTASDATVVFCPNPKPLQGISALRAVQTLGFVLLDFSPDASEAIVTAHGFSSSAVVGFEQLHSSSYPIDWDRLPSFCCLNSCSSTTPSCSCIAMPGSLWNGRRLREVRCTESNSGTAKVIDTNTMPQRQVIKQAQIRQRGSWQRTTRQQ